jgi:hypothetical protein
MRAEAERQASAGGHIITWIGTFSDSADGGTALHRSQDGWCSRGGRNFSGRSSLSTPVQN